MNEALVVISFMRCGGRSGPRRPQEAVLACALKEGQAFAFADRGHTEFLLRIDMPATIFDAGTCLSGERFSAEAWL